MKKIAGFGLIETMISVAISLMMLVAVVLWLNVERSRVLRGDVVSAQAIEMATITRALDAYLSEVEGLPESGAFDVTPEQLVAQELLPANFAFRMVNGNPAFVSPLFLPYTMRAIKQGTGYRGVVLLGGGAQAAAESVAALKRVGLDGVGQGDFDSGMLTLRRLRSEHLVIVAAVRGGTAVADQELSGFSADLGQLLGQTVPRSAIASLVGFTELKVNPPFKVEVEGGGSGSGGESVTVSECTSVSTDSACPADMKSYAEWTACDLPISGQPRNITGPFGTISLSLGERQFFALDYSPANGGSFESNYEWGTGNFLGGTEFPTGPAKVAGIVANSSEAQFNRGPQVGYYYIYSRTCYVGSGYNDCTNSTTQGRPPDLFGIEKKQSTYSCSAVDNDDAWEPVWYVVKDNFVNPIGYSRPMEVKHNGTLLSSYPACLNALPVDQLSGPHLSATWRATLDIGTAKISAGCPAASPLSNPSLPAYQHAAQKLFMTKRPGVGGKLCCK